MTRDPASSASLDELIAMNVVGDLASVQGQLEGAARILRGPASMDPAQVAALLDRCAEQLARITAGIRATDRGEGVSTGDGEAGSSWPGPHPPHNHRSEP